MTAVRRLRSDQRGQASVELIGMLPLLFLAALAAWQLLLVGYAVVSTENAARTASRVQGRGGDGVSAGRESLAEPLRDGARVRLAGDKAEVTVKVPLLAPALSLDGLTVSRHAELPS